MPKRKTKAQTVQEDIFIEEPYERRAKRSKQVCSFCLSAEENELKYGELLTKGDLTCHYFCLLLASGLYQSGNGKGKSNIMGFLLTDIHNEVKRGARLRCTYCHEKGATLGCCHKKCKRTFHLPCGQSGGALHQFFDGFGSFCHEHRPKQSEVDFNKGKMCNICLEPLNEDFSAGNVLHSPCCNNAWFHRLCLQQYAVSAGKHHFRCPLCNSTNAFLKEMKTYGIYIPDQDASWERQNSAYEDLLHRHSTCDADECTCPLGRNHDAESGKYDLLLCSSCGSFGSHRCCRGLTREGSSLFCPLCAAGYKKYLDAQKKSKKTVASGSGSSGYRSSTAQV